MESGKQPTNDTENYSAIHLEIIENKYINNKIDDKNLLKGWLKFSRINF